MKVAVIIAGMYREFETALLSWTFLKFLDHDVYFSTWGTSIEENETLGYNLTEIVNEGRIEKVIKPIQYCIDPPDVIDWVATKNEPNLHKMFYKWYTGIEMLINSKKKYDAVILIRPDLFTEIDESVFTGFLRTLKDHVYYTPGAVFTYKNAYGIDTIGINDQLVIGTQQTISSMVSMFDETSGDAPKDVHSWLCDWFIAHGEVGDIRGLKKSCIIRHNSRGKLGDFTLYNTDAAKWWETRYKKKY